MEGWAVVFVGVDGRKGDRWTFSYLCQENSLDMAELIYLMIIFFGELCTDKITMSSTRNISFGSGGTYNESIQVNGDFVQGDKFVTHSFTQEILEIENLLNDFQKNYSSSEAINQAAHKLATQSENSPEEKNKLLRMGQYVANNGGIEAVIGKVIELAIKLVLHV